MRIFVYLPVNTLLININIETLILCSSVYTLYISKKRCLCGYSHTKKRCLCGYSHTTILSGVLASGARRGVSPRNTGFGQDIFLLTVTPCKPHLYHKNVVISQDGRDTGGTVPDCVPGGSTLDLLGTENYSYIYIYVE